LPPADVINYNDILCNVIKYNLLNATTYLKTLLGRCTRNMKLVNGKFQERKQEINIVSMVVIVIVMSRQSEKFRFKLHTETYFWKFQTVGPACEICKLCTIN